MAMDDSEFTLKLGFKDSPGPGDDFVDLNYQPLNFNNPDKFVGFVVHPGGFTMGQIEEHETWGQVRTLSITVMLNGESRTDVNARVRNLNRFLLRSNLYFEDAGDNPSARSDGKWHDGEATVLTFKPTDAANEVYWDVIAGTPVQPTDLIETQVKSIKSLTFTLLVRAGSRSPLTKGGLARVKLNNGVAMGDAAFPFNVSSTAYGGNFLCGWTFSGTTDWQIGDSTSSWLAPKYGARVLTAQNSGTLTFTTNTFEVKQNDIVIPDIWLARGLSGSPNVTVKLQIWNGSVWADQQTFVSTPTLPLSPSFDAPAWTRFTGTAYQVASGISLVRITGTITGLSGSFAGALGVDGVAMWKNPVGNVAPTTEYATGGKTAGIPTFSVYGLRGDVKTPIKMRIDNTSASQVERMFVLSGMTQDLGTTASRVEYPLFGLDLAATPTATAAAQLPWGTLPGDSTGVATSSTYNLDPSMSSRKLDRRPRIYRAVLWYAANDLAAITAVKLTVAFNSSINTESKTFNLALPQTYAGNTVPTASQYLPFDLGEWQLSRPGIAWEENAQFVNPGAFVTLTHGNNINRHTSIAGVMLLPTKPGSLMAATLDIGNTLPNFPLSVEIYNEGEAPRGGIQASPNSGDIPIELSSYDPNALLTGGDLWVLPAEATSATMGMRFEILMFRDRNATTKLFSFDARDTKQVSIEYTPKYLYGMAS